MKQLKMGLPTLRLGCWVPGLSQCQRDGRRYLVWRTASLSLLLSPLAEFARLGRQGSARRGGSQSQRDGTFKERRGRIASRPRDTF